MPAGGAATPEQEPAERVAAVVRGVPGVIALHPGMFGEVGTYLPGRRIAGVRISAETIDVHIVVVFGAPVRRTAAAVRTAVGALYPGRAINVTVEDVAPAPTPELP